MPETSIPPPAAVARPSKPVSETLLNEKVCPFPDANLMERGNWIKGVNLDWS